MFRSSLLPAMNSHAGMPFTATPIAATTDLPGGPRFVSMRSGERVVIKVEGATDAYHVVDGRLAT